MNNNSKQTKRRFKPFDLMRDGKGISKAQAEFDPGLKGFFISYKNNFSKLVSVNIIMVLGNFPIIFLILNLSGYFTEPYSIPFSDIYQNLGALFITDGAYDPAEMALYSVLGLQKQALADTVTNYIFYGISALTLFTFGIVNVGTAYIVRNMIKREPIFIWSDFWYAVKRNYKQAIPFGIIDCAIMGILIYNLYLLFPTGVFFSDLLFWCNIVILILYYVMRYYIYVQMVTFKLSIFKIIKNSFNLALLGAKRNFMATIGNVIIFALELIFLFGAGGILLPAAVIIPLTVLFSTASFMKLYAAYPKVKQYMIDPYYEEHPEERPEETEVEALMTDDVTEAERLAEIKRRNGIQD